MGCEDGSRDRNLAKAIASERLQPTAADKSPSSWNYGSSRLWYAKSKAVHCKLGIWSFSPCFDSTFTEVNTESSALVKLVGLAFFRSNHH